MSAAQLPSPPDAVLLDWIDAFNSRDLGGLLTLTDADVILHPLRLHGLERTYRGHDGVRRWFARIEELGLRHRIDVTDVSIDGGEVMAVGALAFTPRDDPIPVWVLDRVENGLIMLAHHYLTDPDAFPRPGLELERPTLAEGALRSAIRTRARAQRPGLGAGPGEGGDAAAQPAASRVRGAGPT